MQQASLLVRALNYNVGLQKYAILFITSLEGIAGLSSVLKESDHVFTGVCALKGRDTRPSGGGESK